MSTLFVAWQAPTRAWFPVGRLDVEGENSYVFRYTQGANDARATGFEPLVSFPKLNQRYESQQLFPLFQNRVLDPGRKDFAEYLHWLDLDPKNATPIEILALTGGERQTDSLEVFPQMTKHADQSFSCKFFLHGLRHVSDAARIRATQLKQGELLQVAVELNNPAGPLAIQLQTSDCHLIGWTPRYLVSDLIDGVNEHPSVTATVVRVNDIGAPLARRVLIELTGRLPAGHEPMSSAQFQLIAP